MRRGQSLNQKPQRIAAPVRGRCEAYLYGKIRVPNHRAKTPEFTTVYRLKPGLTRRGTQPLASAMTSSKHVYEVCPRKDKRGADLISDTLPFGLAILPPFTEHFALLNHEKTYLAVAAF